eukprot:TRINITY_DN1190_c0_g1_i5.p1 TRINITY_DN1190_c0_g1~~TRINITY_DN1190_c0_g1_i5.p1  ORF type:complete len:558 (+),score=150.26 TRINITY_DN1190_c0_g1_i5:48-1721(+)
MIRRPPRSTQSRSSAASDVYKRQVSTQSTWGYLNIKRGQSPTMFAQRHLVHRSAASALIVVFGLVLLLPAFNAQNIETLSEKYGSKKSSLLISNLTEKTYDVAFYLDREDKNPREIAFTMVFNGSVTQTPALRVADMKFNYLKNPSKGISFWDSSKRESSPQGDTAGDIPDEDLTATLEYESVLTKGFRFGGLLYKPLNHYLELETNRVGQSFYLIPHRPNHVVFSVNDAYVGYTPPRGQTYYRLFITWDFLQASKDGTYNIVISLNNLRGRFDAEIATELDSQGQLRVSNTLTMNNERRYDAAVISVKKGQDSIWVRIIDVQSSAADTGGAAYRIVSHVYAGDQAVPKAITEQANERKVTCRQDSSKAFTCNWPEVKTGNTTYSFFAVNASSDIKEHLDEFIASLQPHSPELPIQLSSGPNFQGIEKSHLIAAKSGLTGTTIKWENGTKPNTSYSVYVLAFVGNPARSTLPPLVVAYPGVLNFQFKEMKVNDNEFSIFFFISIIVIILILVAGGMWYYKKRQSENAGQVPAAPTAGGIVKLNDEMSLQLLQNRKAT